MRCFTNWLVHERQRNEAAKHGGGAAFLRIDDLGSQIDEPALIEGESPDTAYDHGWARTLVEQAMKRLEMEFQQRENRTFLLELRQRIFVPNGAGPDWEEMALRHGMSHGAVRKAAADIRKRFGVLLRTEVRSVVSNDAEVDDELRYLINLQSIAA